MAYKLGKNTDVNHTEPLPKIKNYGHEYKAEPRVAPEAKISDRSPAPESKPFRKPVPQVELYEAEVEEVPKKKTSGGLKAVKVLFTLVLVALALLPVGFSMLPKMNSVEIPKDPEKIGIIKQEEINLTQDELVVYEEKKEEVMNILLIGVDGDGYKGVRSDVMIIMSINKATKAIHLTSVQRDTMAYLPLKETYEKINHAFAYDGALGSLMTLNQNYDLHLDNFVVFDFKALKKMINAIGGVVVDVSQAEYDDMIVSQEPAPGTGIQKLNADQALIYTRIRYKSGGDEGRNERQREVLKYIFAQAKSMSLRQLKNLADDILPAVQTSYAYSDVPPMIEFFQSIKDGSELVDHSFPFDKKSAMLGGAYYEIPMTVASNITKLHEIVSNFENYTPSDRAMTYHKAIGKKSGYYK